MRPDAPWCALMRHESNRCAYGAYGAHGPHGLYGAYGSHGSHGLRTDLVNCKIFNYAIYDYNINCTFWHVFFEFNCTF